MNQLDPAVNTVTMKGIVITVKKVKNNAVMKNDRVFLINTVVKSFQRKGKVLKTKVPKKQFLILFNSGIRYQEGSSTS